MSLHSRPKGTHFFSPTYASKQKVVKKYSDKLKPEHQRRLKRENSQTGCELLRMRKYTKEDEYAEEDEVFSFHPPPLENKNSIMSESTGFKNPFTGFMSRVEGEMASEGHFVRDMGGY